MTVAMDIGFYFLLGLTWSLILFLSVCWFSHWGQGHKQLYTNMLKIPLTDNKGTLITIYLMKKFTIELMFKQGSL